MMRPKIYFESWYAMNRKCWRIGLSWTLCSLRHLFYCSSRHCWMLMVSDWSSTKLHRKHVRSRLQPGPRCYFLRKTLSPPVIESETYDEHLTSY
jgi:hypothetical protein